MKFFSTTQRIKAASAGLENVVKKRMETSDKEMSTQLDYILQQMNSNSNDKEADDGITYCAIHSVLCIDIKRDTSI